MPRAYLGFSLRKGDHDLKRRFGGQKLEGVQGDPVAALQTDLAAVGLSAGKADGAFGDTTRSRLALLQAALRHGARVLAKGKARDEAPLAVRHDGVLDEPTAAALARLAEKGESLTGWLLRLPVSQLAATRTNSGFDRLRHDEVAKGDLVLDRDFAADLRALDAAAQQRGLVVLVNQVFRRQGDAVAGAIVKPATRSQHLIGHALDLNLQDGPVLNNSSLQIAGKWTPAAKDFAQHAQGLGLRWGAKFSPTDPVHFDRKVDPGSALWEAKFLLNQEQLRSGQPIGEA